MSNNNKIIEKVLFDTENLFQTAKHSKTRNRLHSQDDIEVIEQKLIDKVLATVNSGSYQSGSIEMAYDAFFVIDKISEGTLFNTEPTASNPPEHQVNFFVRLGRAPAISIV